MSYEEDVAQAKKLFNIGTFKIPSKYKIIIESLPEFWRWVDKNKIKLKKNLLKSTFLALIKNGENYDLKFTQDIGRRYKPSTKEWVERRHDHFVAIIENVPLDQIHAKYEWIMGR